MTQIRLPHSQFFATSPSDLYNAAYNYYQSIRVNKLLEEYGVFLFKKSIRVLISSFDL